MANEIEQLNSEIEQLAKRVEQLKNFNILTKEKYDEISDLALNELYAVETPAVVETYSDDDGNWYRVYSDGWVEQGGLYKGNNNQSGTLTLLKPYSDLNYIINLQSNRNGAAAINAPVIYGKTTSTITFQNWVTDGVNGGMWQACGQGE